jgi:hypothetical protein
MKKIIAKKLYCQLLLSSFLLLFACMNKSAFIVGNNRYLAKIEEQDHKSCLDLKVRFNSNTNLENQQYWQCRLSFAKYRLLNNPSDQKQQKHNEKIVYLINKISDKLADKQPSLLEREVEKLDEKHHQQCQNMGYESETEDKNKIDIYLQCRSSLIDNYLSEPPYDNYDYLPYQYKNYDISYVINKRIKIASQKKEKIVQDYPKCTSYALYSQELKKCIENQQKARFCYQQNLRNSILKERDAKLICQQQANIRFDDNLLIQEKIIDRIKERNYKSDLTYNFNFESMGLNELDFISKQEKKKIELEQEKEQEEENNFNSTTALYNRYELSQIRKKYVLSCYKFVDNNLLQDKNNLDKKCLELENTIF